MSRLEKEIHWWPTGDSTRPWAVWFEGDEWELEVTNRPGQPPLYSLLIRGRKEEEFVDWPENWTTAPDNGGNASQRAEYERELEYWKKNIDALPVDDDELEG